MLTAFRGVTALEIAKRIGGPAPIDPLGGEQTDLYERISSR
jgi:hypothetical protein